MRKCILYTFPFVSQFSKKRFLTGHRSGCPVAEPLFGHGLVPVFPQDRGARHPVAPMFRRVVVVDQNRAADDRVRSAEGQVRVGEELDSVLQVPLSSGDVEKSKLVDEVADLAADLPLVVGALLVRVDADLVRVVVISGAQTASRPVEEVLAGGLNVDVPAVVAAVVLAAVGVDQRLDEDGRVGERLVLGLAEDDPSGHRVGEGRHGGDELLVVELDVGAEPPLGHRRLVDDDRPTDERIRAEEGQRWVDDVLLFSIVQNLFFFVTDEEAK